MATTAIGTITVPVAVKVNGEWQEVGEVSIPLTIAGQKTNPHTQCREITITTETDPDRSSLVRTHGNQR